MHFAFPFDGIRQKFTGYQNDTETGLDFAEARMYENRHARFTAVDPLLASGKSANPQTFNRYVYVLNSPLILTDPTGLQTASVGGNYRKCTNDCGPGGGTWRTEGNSTTVYPDGNIAEVQSLGADEQPIPKNTVPLGMTAVSAPTPVTSPLNPILGPLVDGANQGLTNFEEGARVGSTNAYINTANAITGSITGSQFSLPGLITIRNPYWSNPLEIPTLNFSTQRASEIGSAFSTGLPLAFGFTYGATRGGGQSAAPIAATNEQIIARAATFGAKRVTDSRPWVAGIQSHSRATAFIDRYQRRFGDRGLETSRYFSGPNGRRGSSTLDVFDKSTGTAYDFKFGRPFMSNRQFTRYSGLPGVIQVKIVDRFGNIFNR